MRTIKFRFWEKPYSKGFNGWMHYDSDEHFFNWYRNKDYETMQFTGLKDKNGKEIYEGDIVRETIDVSYYAEGAYGSETEETEVRFDNYGFEPFCRYAGFGSLDMDAREFEVIGNIYENPELLVPKPIQK